jgi:hypothetical protein
VPQQSGNAFGAPAGTVAPVQATGRATTTAAPALPPNTPTAAEYASPTALASAFYTWYLATYGIASMRDTVVANLSAWLTPTFAANWQTSLAATEVDPFILAQDAPPADSTISSAPVTQTATSSTIDVLVRAGAGSSLTYTVNLLLVNKEWRIDTVSGVR